MATLSDFFSCSIGGAPFRLEDYGYTDEPIKTKEGPPAGRRCKITGEGWIEGTDASDFAAKIDAVCSSLRAGGQDIIIKGLGGQVERQVLAAQCTDKGPHVSIELHKGISDGSPLRRKISFSATADLMEGADTGGDTPPPPSAPIDSFRQKVTVKADGLRVLERSGEINGRKAAATFLSSILPAFRDAYPLPRWVVTHDYEESSGGQGLKTTYRMTATEFHGELPWAGGSESVEGDLEISRERDEQQRLVGRYEINLVVKGDPYELLDYLRTTVPADEKNGVRIVRESATVSLVKQAKLKATFVTLAGGDGNLLLNWTQTLKEAPAAQVWEPKLYEGADPVLVVKPQGVKRYVQSGSAVGLGKFLKPPPPLSENFLDEPEFSYTDDTRYEKRTTWQYVFFLDEGDDVTHITPAALGRPNQPEFWS